MRRNPSDKHVGRQFLLFTPALPTEGIVQRRLSNGDYEVVLERVIRTDKGPTNITRLPSEVLEAFLTLNAFYYSLR